MTVRNKAFLAVVMLVAGSLGLIRMAHAVEIQKVVSPAGIEAWLVEDHTVPIIALNFSFDGGATQDPEGKEGLTRLLAASMDEGAGDMTSEQFQAKLEELSISIGFSTGKDRFYGSLRTLTPTLAEAVDLLAMAIDEPRFDATPVERMKTSLVTRAKRNESNPDAIAGRSLAEAMFGTHPYARPTLGSVASLTGLTSEDLKAQHSKILARKGLTVGVVGAIDAETLKPVLDTLFQSLPAQGDLVPVAEFDPAHGDRISRELDIPQTNILVALPGLKRDDPDYQAAYVMNHILGGGIFSSWMFEEVREKRGLSYGANTALAPYRHSGILVGSAATRADRANETIEVMLEQIERMANEGPNESELSAAKQFITGSYPLRFDSSSKIARQLVGLQNENLGIDYLERRNTEIEAVSLEDVQRVAKRLLSGKEPTIVTVGPGQG